MNPECELVEAVLRRAPGAFERLMREYQGLCWHIIQRMVRHPDDARELCQDTFLRVYRHLDQYRYESPLKYWIGRIAYSIALRHLQRQRTATGADGAEADPPVSPEDEADAFDLEAAHADHAAAQRVHACLDALAPLQRTVLMLYHFDELTIPEIAQITGLAQGTIKSHLFRSRLRLREMLESTAGSTP
jgi:RNA polymerase sigma-70 factor (ECF subfamily)